MVSTPLDSKEGREHAELGQVKVGSAGGWSVYGWLMFSKHLQGSYNV